jgi:hypothetical protein
VFPAFDRRVWLGVIFAATACCVAACGGSASTPAGATPPAVSAPPAGATADSSAAAPSSPGAAGDCGGDAASAITAALTSTAGGTVTIIGGCHQATIATTLGDADVSKALDICDAAAAVGYTGGVSSISVTSASGKELAIGLSTAPCIGEP